MEFVIVAVQSNQLLRETFMNQPTVLITGALTGIGRATAIAFAKQGANIVISGRRDDAGAVLATELRTLGAKAEFVKADVTNEVEVRQLVEQSVKLFGRLDIAINNAGTEGALGPITEQSVDNYQSTFSTNVLGTLLSIKHEMRAMQAQGGGSIVNLSSIAGLVGVPGASVYAASKHAVEGLTKSAALEGAAVGIRVNAVAPGPVATDMLDRFVGRDESVKAGFLASIPAKRAATVEEIADTIVFLASAKAPYITGQSIAVDGGYTTQ
jgi:NAD(P)-dependent dehydrogenase (short-subunit alcohol dehydrogenase family)